MNPTAPFHAGAPPRTLTTELRAELGFPVRGLPPYRWAFACLVVGVACIPLVLASLWKMAFLAVFVGLIVVPLVRQFEHREASWGEEVYRSGVETIGRVIDVEPAGAQHRDHLVRVQFVANGALVQASVIGCRLAVDELGPEEKVVVIYDAKAPQRCLVVARADPAIASAESEIVDAIFED
jgi:hypothetical protein